MKLIETVSWLKTKTQGGLFPQCGKIYDVMYSLIFGGVRTNGKLLSFNAGVGRQVNSRLDIMGQAVARPI